MQLQERLPTTGPGVYENPSRYGIWTGGQYFAGTLPEAVGAAWKATRA